MTDRDQQDELPCEGCPDPGMPCLGCPAVDQRDEPAFEIPETTHESVAIQYGKDAAANAFALGRNKGFTEGERAATELIVKWLREQREQCMQNVIDYEDGAEPTHPNAVQPKGYADAIERGEHE